MPARLGAVLCVAVALTGCATAPKSTDAVRDSATAISIAKKACSLPQTDNGHWEARFRMGLWEVTETSKGENCGWNYRVDVWPDTGAARRCEECVVET